MTKRFVINESEKKQILKLYGLLSEDKPVEAEGYYSIPGKFKSINFFVSGGKIFPAVYDERLEAVKRSNITINGDWEDFKVSLFKSVSVGFDYTNKNGERKTINIPQVEGKVIKNGFDLNQESMINSVDEIPNWGVDGGFFNQVLGEYKPSVRGSFQFLAITPSGFKKQGEPQIFTAKIVVNRVEFWESQGKTETTEDMVISPLTYQRVGKFGKKKKLAYALKFYDSPQAASISKKKDDNKEKIKFDFKITEPFKYDTIDFYDSSIEDKLNDFVKQINAHLNNPKYGDRYRGFLQRNPIRVSAYASIDADSNEISQGKLPQCQNPKQKKFEYNLCLSQKRADVIKKFLEEKLGDVFIKSVGKGETDEFAPGKKWPNSKNTEETKPNRVVVISVPEFDPLLF